MLLYLANAAASLGDQKIGYVIVNSLFFDNFGGCFCLFRVVWVNVQGVRFKDISSKYLNQQQSVNNLALKINIAS